MAHVAVAPGRHEPALPRLAPAARLLAERGYALRADALAALLGAPVDAVRDAARAEAGLRLERDHVVPAGREALVAPSAARAAAHRGASARWEPVAREYARMVARHVPWARVVLVSGSLASGGFDDGDDIDVSLVVAPGTKHLSYLACLALALPLAWRHRRRAHGAEARLPVAPKLVCINVVWTEREALPFERQDEAMALEVALSRPLWGGDRWRAILARNPALASGYAAQLGPDEGDARPSRAARLIARLTRPAVVSRALDASAYALARLLHAWVRWHRRDAPEVRARVARLEATKHPYAILDREPRRAP